MSTPVYGSQSMLALPVIFAPATRDEMGVSGHSNIMGTAPYRSRIEGAQNERAGHQVEQLVRGAIVAGYVNCSCYPTSAE